MAHELPLILALDGMDRDAALRLVDRFTPRVPVFKIGLELLCRCGPEVVGAVRERGAEVFLDGKFHDIPATVFRAVQAACGHRPWALTLHASGGEAMLRAAREGRGEHPTKLLAVTLLTSDASADAAERVLERARLAREKGMDGVVASAREAARIRALGGGDFLIVTPGIRPSGSAANDQARVATPAEAIRAGADWLVIGRPITAADDPERVLDEIEEEVRRARR